jgi:diguanylate cyclase (GGDEF)-like protein
MLQAAVQAVLFFLFAFLAVCAVIVAYRAAGRKPAAMPAPPPGGGTGDFAARATRLLDHARRTAKSFALCAVVPPAGEKIVEPIQSFERAIRRDDPSGVLDDGAWAVVVGAGADHVLARLAEAARGSQTGLRFGSAVLPTDGEKFSVLREKAVQCSREAVLISSAFAAPIRELPGGWKDLVMPQELDQALGRYMSAHEDDPRGVSALHLDIDNFKLYSEQYGPRAGADIVQQLGAVMRRSVRYTDFVAHMRDDEFLVLMPALPDQARCAAQRLLNVVRKTVFPTGGQELKITVSFGIASYPAYASTISDLREFSGIALRAAKTRGRNTFAAYEPDMAAHAAGPRTDSL